MHGFKFITINSDGQEISCFFKSIMFKLHSEPIVRHILKKSNVMNVDPPSFSSNTGPEGLKASLFFNRQGSLLKCRGPKPSCHSESEELLFLCPAAGLGAPVLSQPPLEPLSSTHRQGRSTHQLSVGLGTQVWSCYFQKPLTAGPSKTW